MDEYNHNRPLSDFKDYIEVIKAAGFNPIAVTQYYLEDTFIFNTDEEANNAYALLEKEKGLKAGWWYPIEEFEKLVEEYERENECKVLIHWLKENKK